MLNKENNTPNKHRGFLQPLIFAILFRRFLKKNFDLLWSTRLRVNVKNTRIFTEYKFDQKIVSRLYMCTIWNKITFVCLLSFLYKYLHFGILNLQEMTYFYLTEINLNKATFEIFLKGALNIFLLYYMYFVFKFSLSLYIFYLVIWDFDILNFI